MLPDLTIDIPRILVFILLFFCVSLQTCEIVGKIYPSDNIYTYSLFEETYYMQ